MASSAFHINMLIQKLLFKEHKLILMRIKLFDYFQQAKLFNYNKTAYQIMQSKCCMNTV